MSSLGVKISIPQIFLPSEVSLEDVGEIINKDERRDKAFRDKVSSKLKLLELERGCDIWFKMLPIPHKKSASWLKIIVSFLFICHISFLFSENYFKQRLNLFYSLK